MSEEKAGFKIGAAFYPAPSSFRVGDAVLIREVTGMEFQQFAEALDDDDLKKDPVILAGLIAAAIWQAKPQMKRSSVVKLVEQIDFDSLSFEGGDGEEAEVEVNPPAEAGVVI